MGGPASVALDGEGRLWFSQYNANQLGYMDTTTGDFTLMAIPASAANPGVIVTTGSDVWATALGGGTDNLLRVDLTSFVAPVNATSPNIDAVAGETFTGPLATFQTSDSGAISYVIDYGNGVTETGGFTGGPGVYTIPADVTYAAEGNYDTTITISTADGDVVKMLGTAVVTSGNSEVVGEGINLTGSEDQALAPNRTIDGQPVLAVATFSGADANYSALVTWGDGTTSQGDIVALGGGMFAVVVSTPKIYATNSSFDGSVTITGGTNDLTVGFTADISDTPMTVSSGLQLETLNGRHVNGTVATCTADVDSTVNWFVATINWGDGSTSSGVVIQDSAGQYSVLGQHLYKGKKATYTILTQITNTVEDVTQTATATITI
jgi:hypothetical protein